ncbi:MAG TPA: hypothetical protein VKY35_08650 [Aliidiomarina sp.]|nr:hypothetical protein [Aliidiomarina sp.]
MNELFPKRNKWRITVTLGAITALILMLFTHSIITMVAIFPDKETLSLINSIYVYDLINHTEFWNAQAFFLSAPKAASHFWWHPFWFGAVAGFVIIIWLMTLIRRISTGAAVWLLLLLSVTTLVSLSDASSMLAEIFSFTERAIAPGSGTAQAVALYLAAGALFVSLGRWRS